MYQGQKVHIFCPSLSFLAEAQPRLNKRGQKALFGRGAHRFFWQPHELQNKRKTSLKKLQIYFVSTFFK
jgi:hypothetical protein